jgi:hypothetical protein
MFRCLPPKPGEEADMKQFWKDRFEMWTPLQREAIAAYLQEWANSDSLVVEVYAEDIPRAIKQLLGNESASHQ